MDLKAKGLDPLIDSYTAVYNDWGLRAVHPSTTLETSAVGQSFTVLSDFDYKITYALFDLKKVGSPVGNLVAQLYAHSGTYGTSSVPTGSALAESNPVAMADLLTSYAYYTFTFPEAQQYKMTKALHYCIECVVKDATTLDASNYPVINYRGFQATHSGNFSQFKSSAWAASAYDTIFYVYGDAVVPAGNPLINKPLILPVKIKKPLFRT